MCNLFSQVWLVLFMLLTRYLIKVYFIKNGYFNSIPLKVLISKFNQLPIQAPEEIFGS